MNIRAPRSENGSAALIVLVLLGVMVTLAIGNNIALGHLERELRLVDNRQLQRYGGAAITNLPPTRKTP